LMRRCELDIPNEIASVDWWKTFRVLHGPLLLVSRCLHIARMRRRYAQASAGVDPQGS